VKIVPFGAEHVEPAAALLEERHRRHREAEPLLPAEVDFRAEVHALLEKEGAAGAFAEKGYVLGVPLDEDVWGPNVWVQVAGHAVDEHELVRDLYASAAAEWVESGRTRHYALVPAHDLELIDAWFRLGFGQQQAYGIRALPEQVEVNVPDGFSIRPPNPADVEGLIDVDLALPAHQALSPVFSERSRTSREESRREWESTFAETEEEILIGYAGEKPVACWSVVAAERSRHFYGLSLPPNACYLAFAVTLPDARGSGIGVALTEACLARARELGYQSIVTDWRVTNLLASRFWPTRGFRPIFLRLYRSIP
jgi:ribosomal protein S18 acetylase RimI-like enzyme